MIKLRKISFCALISASLMMCMSLVVFAANEAADFEGKLPKNQGDVKVSTIKKGNKVEYFTITMTEIDGFDRVCAWTEGSLGANYSSPFNQVHLDEEETVAYDKVPKVGQNVSLNLDNPVKVDYTVKVAGSWNPD